MKTALWRPSAPCAPATPGRCTLARSLKDAPGGPQLTATQRRFYDLVREQGEISLAAAAQALNLSEAELRRDFATLRHLELLRACKKGDIILITRF